MQRHFQPELRTPTARPRNSQEYKDMRNGLKGLIRTDSTARQYKVITRGEGRSRASLAS